MKSLTVCVACGWALLLSLANARLVPKNFCDEPPVQRLTATFTREQWETQAFGQCAGISLRPVDRKSTPGRVGSNLDI